MSEHQYECHRVWLMYAPPEFVSNSVVMIQCRCAVGHGSAFGPIAWTICETAKAVVTT